MQDYWDPEIDENKPIHERTCSNVLGTCFCRTKKPYRRTLGHNGLVKHNETSKITKTQASIFDNFG